MGDRMHHWSRVIRFTWMEEYLCLSEAEDLLQLVFSFEKYGTRYLTSFWSALRIPPFCGPADYDAKAFLRTCRLMQAYFV